MHQDDELALRIIERVAEREDADPIEMSPPLHEVVDTEALESLFEPERASRSKTSVTFTYRGHPIRVEGSGQVHVGESSAESVHC